MNHHFHQWANATERVAVTNRDDLDTSYIEVGEHDWDMESALSVKGAAVDRANFFAALAAAATAESARLLAEVDQVAADAARHAEVAR
ncbi:MAG: hypothetical protein FWD95_01950 [Nocardioidaceae bacterium]|nr:hypothetical protein [Nocardioidaceae bacterium]